MDESQDLHDGLIQEPPADWLIASYLGYKAPHSAGAQPRNIREAARANSSMLGEMRSQGVKLGGRKPLAQMPAYLRTPEKMAMIQKMKDDWKAS